MAQEQRGCRKRFARASTINVGRLPMREIEAERAATPRSIYWRPITRGDCADVPRPCPFVACSQHLYLDVLENGSLKLNFPDIEPDAMGESCALDVADRGGSALEEVGEYANLTRERVRQIETRALAVLREGRLHMQVIGENRIPCRSDHEMEPTE